MPHMPECIIKHMLVRGETLAAVGCNFSVFRSGNKLLKPVKNKQGRVICPCSVIAAAGRQTEGLPSPPRVISAC